MIMKNYPNYIVPEIQSFKGIIEYIYTNHINETAFEDDYVKYTYRQFIDMFLRVASSIKEYDKNYIFISANCPLYFSIAYFACVTTGNIAVLASSKEEEFIRKIPIDIELSNEEIIKRCESDKLFEVSELKDIDNNEVCTILHSSGTSSAPKGIMLSQKNICSNVRCGLQKYLMKKGDRFINLIPMYHAFGLVCDVLAPLTVGATICMIENKNYFFLKMSKFKPTILNIPPIIAESLLKFIEKSGNVEKVTGGNLRKLLCGGAALNKKTSEALRKYGILALGCYGISECSPCVSVNRDNYYKDGSVGVLLDCNTVKISTDGEILIKGDNVMLGYYQDEHGIEGKIDDGYFYTGDLGYFDKDGFLYVVGRKSNLIVFEDGTKCVPETIEEELRQIQFINEVLVYSVSLDGRTYLNIDVYSEDNDALKIKELILIKINGDYPIKNINISTNPLDRTSTGKIRRER